MNPSPKTLKFIAPVLVILCLISWAVIVERSASAQSAAPMIIQTITVGSGNLIDIAVSQLKNSSDPIVNKAYVVNRGTTRLNVIDTSTNTVVGEAAVNQPFGVALNENTSRVYASNQFANAVEVIDPANNQRIALVRPSSGGGFFPFRLAVNRTMNRVYVTSYSQFTTADGKLRVIDGATNTIAATIDVANSRHVAVSETLNRAYVTDTTANTVNVINASNNTIETSISLIVGSETNTASRNPTGIAVNDTTGRLYVTRKDGRLIVIDTNTNAVVTAFFVGVIGEASDVAVNDQINRIYVSFTNGQFRAVNGETNASSGVSTGKQINALDVDKNTNRIYAANTDGTITVLEEQGITPPTADLALTVTDNPDPAIVGQEVEYIITAVNSFNSLPAGTYNVCVETREARTFEPRCRTVTLPAAGSTGNSSGVNFRAAQIQIQTPTGDNITATIGSSTTLTFRRVVVGGVTTLTPVNPPPLADLLAIGYTDPKAAFNIKTSAQVTPPIEVCYQLPDSFAFTLATGLLVKESGKLKNVTTRVNAATRTVCGTYTPPGGAQGLKADEGFQAFGSETDLGEFVIAEATNVARFDSTTLNVAENGGVVTFTVTRTGDTSQPASVMFQTADDAAVAGQDYVATSGTLDFLAGETTKTIIVQILNDRLIEPDESFFVRFTDSSNVATPEREARATITDTPAKRRTSFRPRRR